MRKLFLTRSRKYGFAHDFYEYALRGLGFDSRDLIAITETTDAKYLFHSLPENRDTIGVAVWEESP